MPKSTQLFRTEGIILHALNFGDYDKILTFFSPYLGVAKLFVKGGARVRQKKSSLSSPLTRGEYVYKKGHSGLLLCREISVVDHYLSLRKRLSSLEVACGFVRALQKSQLPEKPAPALYQLLIRYLDAIPLFSSPEVLGASFCLKLLRHEGLLGAFTHCNACRVPLSAVHIVQGESFCRKHARENAITFSLEEVSTLNNLAYCRTISELLPLAISLSLKGRIDQLLIEAILLA